MSTVNDEHVYATVGEELAAAGAVSLQTIVEKTGVSVGSLYHRYGSREGLFAETWLDAVTAFQARFLAEMASDRDDAGARAALVTPQFCRENRAQAIVLCSCRESEFLSETTPTDLLEKIRTVNDAAAKALRRFAKRRGYAIEACMMGMVAFPLGAVRLYLPSRAVPKAIDRFVVDAFWSAVGANQADSDRTS